MANYTSVRNISVLRFSTRIAAIALLSLHISFAQVEPKAGTWSTWVASPVNQLRLPAPPAAANTPAEIQIIKNLMAEGNDTTRAQIAYWDAGSPAYRWEQIAAAQMLAKAPEQLLGRTLWESWPHEPGSPFEAACRRSVAEKIPLHVSLTPPGHTDLGWYTIFPHCPRCKAAAQVGGGNSDEAIKSVEAIIAKADPENVELHARAYNILGNAYRRAGKKKEALLAFLHVDLLYSKFPDQHAEALANLATLWAEVDKADRAAQARGVLKEKYPDSVWAAK